MRIMGPVEHYTNRKKNHEKPPQPPDLHADQNPVGAPRIPAPSAQQQPLGPGCSDRCGEDLQAQEVRVGGQKQCLAVQEDVQGLHRQPQGRLGPDDPLLRPRCTYKSNPGTREAGDLDRLQEEPRHIPDRRHQCAGREVPGRLRQFRRGDLVYGVQLGQDVRPAQLHQDALKDD